MKLFKLGTVTFLILLMVPFVSSGQTLVQLADVSSETGQIVSVPVVVENFSGVAVFELYINHSPTIAEFIELNGLTPSPVVNEINGITSISWFTTTPLSLSDGDTLLTLNYQVSGLQGESTELGYTEDCYLANQTSHVIPTTFSDGSITVYNPFPPEPFSLISPADSTVISYEPPFDIEFSWSLSTDPNPGEEVHYTYWCTVSAEGLGDTTLSFANLTDTLYTVNIPDSLNLELWPDSINVVWHVDAISGGDTVHSNETWLLTFAPSLDVDDEIRVIPEDFRITSIYPNPFNPSATVSLNLPKTTNLRIEAYNIMGQRVAVIQQGQVEAGIRKFLFDGSQLSSGNYFILATTSNGMRTGKKIVLMK